MAQVGSAPMFAMPPLNQPSGSALACYIVLGAIIGVVAPAPEALQESWRKMRSSFTPVLAAVLLVSFAACSKHPTPEAPATKTEPVAPEAPEPPPDPAQEARKLFNTKCVVCHGDHGAGDGPGAAALNPKPRAFGDAMWQANVTDDQIKKTIVGGGAAVGKSAAMSANPELADKADELTALVKIVRNFKH